jgi:hypothetical protein
MLFHFELQFPTEAKLHFGTMDLVYTKHARRACKTDRYGTIYPPKKLNTDNAKVIEAEIVRTPDNTLQTKKVLYRVPYKGTNDLCIVLIPDTKTVKTVWLNEVSDVHTTLKTNRYNTPNDLT